MGEELIREFERASAESRANAQNRWEQVHTSMGLAVYDPQNDRAVIDVVRRADKIMYENKRVRKTAWQSR